MKVLIAPDSFKGSMTSVEYCDIAEGAIKKIYPDSSVTKFPLADGGEGTVDALTHQTNGTIHKVTVTDPIGNNVEAVYGILGDGKTAVIEMAAASGLPLIEVKDRNPMFTTTFGTGELVKDALDKGCNNFILGIGGSATNDGGAGMMQALGFRLLNENGEEIERGAKGLSQLYSIDSSKRDKRLDNVEFYVACDVNNPLCGPNGASYVYAPQKGATVEQLPILDKSLKHFADVIKKELGKEVENLPGSGAAGGLGAGLVAFLDAKLSPGFQIIADRLGLEELIKTNDFDLVITGEGEINHQTVNGKLPCGVASLAKKYNIPVIAIVGSIGKGAEQVYEKGINSIFSIVQGPCTLEYAMENTKELLNNTVTRVMKTIKIYFD